jgi:ferric-chelate reductase (NADPH)
MNLMTRTVAEAASKVFFRSAEITSVDDYGSHFRSIEISGEALKKASWALGDKLQVRMDQEGLTTRTYTPTWWDTDKGATRLLTYGHGRGPGSAWIERAAPGRPCQLFGPRSSLKIDDLQGLVAFVGDETSFALVSAWQTQHIGEQPALLVFEVAHADESTEVLDAIGVSPSNVFLRRENAAHVPELAAAVIGQLRRQPETSLCLTGKAQTIAAVRQAVKAAGLSRRPTQVKAYWDENRSGLD